LLEAARATGALGAQDAIVATIGLGEVHLALGDVARGSALLEGAWDEARAIDAWDLAAEVALAFSRIGLLPTPDSGAARADQAEVAFARLSEADPFRRGLLATYLYNILAFVDEHRAASYLDEAVRMAERDPALAPYVDVCVLRRDVETGREPTVAVHTAAALARRDRRTNPLAAAMAEVLGASAAVAAGEALDGAVLDRLVVEGRELGRADVTHYAMSITSLVDSVGRDARRAERSVGAAQEFGAAAGLPVAGTVGLLQGAAIRRETQRAHEIRPMLEFATSAGYAPFPLLLAEARLADGDTAGATELVAGVLDGLADLPSWARASSAALAVEVTDVLGTEVAQRDVADLTSILASHSGQMVVLALVAMHLGPADRYIARLAVRSGDLDRALDRIQAARELAAAAETVLWSGWCAVDEAVIRARRGEPAGGLLDEATGVARALGSLRLAAAVDAAR
jgi:hypothetical protein